MTHGHAKGGVRDIRAQVAGGAEDARAAADLEPAAGSRLAPRAHGSVGVVGRGDSVAHSHPARVAWGAHDLVRCSSDPRGRQVDGVPRRSRDRSLQVVGPDAVVCVARVCPTDDATAGRAGEYSRPADDLERLRNIQDIGGGSRALTRSCDRERDRASSSDVELGRIRQDLVLAAGAGRRGSLYRSDVHLGDVAKSADSKFACAAPIALGRRRVAGGTRCRARDRYPRHREMEREGARRGGRA